MNRDLLIGFLGAVGFHVLALFGLTAGLFEETQYGVSEGESSVEVSLVSSIAQPEVTESKVQENPPEIPEAQAIQIAEIPDEFMPEAKPQISPVPAQNVAERKKEEPKKVEAQKSLSTASAASFASDGGALAQPFYLRNPPPTYPESARRKGEEGVVLLWVKVDEEGEVVSIQVKESSGFTRLDEAAAKGVQRWKFKPARVGSVAVASQVEIPIRFRLNEEDRY